MQPSPDLRIYGVKIDDRPSTFFTHVRESSLHRPPSSPNRCVQRLSQHFIGFLFQLNVWSRSKRIVYQNIDRAKVVNCHRHCIFNRRFVRNVGMAKQRFASLGPQISCNGLSKLLAQLCNNDGSTLFNEVTRYTFSNATTRSSDQSHFILKKIHNFRLFVNTFFVSVHVIIYLRSEEHTSELQSRPHLV